jgi:uncharacterized protein
MGRDRDRAGRPKNARPRDALGRPLPRSAPGEPGMPDSLTLDPAEAARLADELLLADRPFHAHEVLEAAWKAAPERERDLWQGLAQIAVGLTHGRRGNARGAVTLLRRGAQRLSAYEAARLPADDPYGMDVARVLEDTERLADGIETAGLEAIPAADFRLRLT